MFLKNAPLKMKKLIYFSLLTFIVACGSKSQQSTHIDDTLADDTLAQYRDTLIGRFNGIDIDTLICEPIDSLSPIEYGRYGGCHYEWRVYSTNGTVKDLIVGNTIGINFIKEGDLDGNGTEEWGYVTQWPTSQWMGYHAFTNINGEWQHIIEPTSIWLPHLDPQDSIYYTIREEDILQPSERSEFIKAKFSRNNDDDYLIIDTIIRINPHKINEYN